MTQPLDPTPAGLKGLSTPILAAALDLLADADYATTGILKGSWRSLFTVEAAGLISAELEARG